MIEQLGTTAAGLRRHPAVPNERSINRAITSMCVHRDGEAVSAESRCHAVATIQWQRAVTDGASWKLPDSCPTRNFDTLPHS